MNTYANGGRILYPSQSAKTKAQLNSQQLMNQLLLKKNESQCSALAQQQYPATNFTYYQEAQPQNINKVRTSSLKKLQKMLQGQQQKGFQISPPSPKFSYDKLIQLVQQYPVKVNDKNESEQFVNYHMGQTRISFRKLRIQ